MPAAEALFSPWCSDIQPAERRRSPITSDDQLPWQMRSFKETLGEGESRPAAAQCLIELLAAKLLRWVREAGSGCWACALRRAAEIGRACAARRPDAEMKDREGKKPWWPPAGLTSTPSPAAGVHVRDREKLDYLARRDAEVEVAGVHRWRLALEWADPGNMPVPRRLAYATTRLWTHLVGTNSRAGLRDYLRDNHCPTTSKNG